MLNEKLGEPSKQLYSQFLFRVIKNFKIKNVAMFSPSLFLTTKSYVGFRETIFKDINVDYCQFKPEIIQVERDESIDKSKEQISADFWLKDVIVLLDKARDILGQKFECNSYKIEDLIIDVKDYGRNYKECLGSQLQPCIGADGNVYVCTNHRGHKKYSYGSLYKNSFKEIWDNIKQKK